MAYKRFGDNIPKLVDAKFIRGMGIALDERLRGVDKNEAQCREWLAEPVAIVRKREELLGKKARLEAARKQLSVFNNSRSRSGI